MSDPSKPPGGPEGVSQIQIDIDEVTAQGAYSNLVLLNHNDNEFVLDFAPRHAKRLARALEANLRRYEERFGRITDDLESPPHSGQVS